MTVTSETPPAEPSPSGPNRPRSPRRQQSALANPVLIGAVTVLVILLAVFLAYNANNGLPFVPTRELNVNIASGSDLVPGDEVREGGFRIGLVSALEPTMLASGQVVARLTLKLDQAHGKVPVDSTATISSRSALGLKYVNLHRGTAERVFADGGTMPITQTHVPVQFEDIFQMFDPKTRRAIQTNLVGFGNTFAGRGSALNDTIASLPQLLLYLRPVAKYLSAPSTQLTRFLRSIQGFMGTVAPVAPTAARLFTELATTFAAIGHNPSALEATIRESPSTIDVTTNSLKVQQPFLVNLDTLGRELTPATAALKSALPVINPAIEAGTITLARTPVLNANLQQVLDALKALSLAPGTNMAVNALTGTVSTLNPMVKYLGPFQTVCNDWNYFWTYLSEHISEQTSFGLAQRVLINLGNPAQPNNIGQQGAVAPVDGGGTDSLLTGGNEFLHSQAYGAAVGSAGNADCETGQRGYVKKLNFFDPQHRNLAVDAHTPGNQGTTFTGRTHVPKGETFSRNPLTGPQLPKVPGNS
jgi:phospholipid/cholesterol/gamma-HCH transport system substrate-binding protein